MTTPNEAMNILAVSVDDVGLSYAREKVAEAFAAMAAELAAAKAEAERMSGELEGASRMAKHYVRERQAARADAQLERERAEAAIKNTEHAEACELAAYEMVKKAEADAAQLRGLLHEIASQARNEVEGFTVVRRERLLRIDAALAADGAPNPEASGRSSATPTCSTAAEITK